MAVLPVGFALGLGAPNLPVLLSWLGLAFISIVWGCLPLSYAAGAYLGYALSFITGFFWLKEMLDMLLYVASFGLLRQTTTSSFALVYLAAATAPGGLVLVCRVVLRRLSFSLDTRS